MMIIVDAIKKTVAQRHLVRRVKEYVKGDFKIDDKIKMLNIKLDKDTYTSCIPKKLKEYAKDIADKTGEYSKNPIKKIVSWVKSYIANVKEMFKNLKNPKKAADVSPDVSSASKPETIKFNITDAPQEI